MFVTINPPVWRIHTEFPCVEHVIGLHGPKLVLINTVLPVKNAFIPRCTPAVLFFSKPMGIVTNTCM